MRRQASPSAKAFATRWNACHSLNIGAPYGITAAQPDRAVGPSTGVSSMACATASAWVVVSAWVAVSERDDRARRTCADDRPRDLPR